MKGSISYSNEEINDFPSFYENELLEKGLRDYRERHAGSFHKIY